MSDIRILNAAEAERQRMALAEVLADCVNDGASVSFMLPFSVEDAYQWWGGVIESVSAGDTVLLGAFIDGELLGTVQLGLNTPPNQPHRADVKKLLVHRKARQRGLARGLMASMELEAQRLGRTVLVLDTVTGSNGERLYAGLGWTKSGVIPKYALMPDGALCSTTVFWKDLA